MTGYQAPKVRLHREFLYLNHDTVLNSLSALEAGKVDEIIQKVSQAREGGLDASLVAGPLRGGGKRKKVAAVEEELVRTRTWFSAYEEWYRHLTTEGGLGTFDVWDANVREALSVGDTLEFTADVVISPLHKLMRTFMSYADGASSMFGISGAELSETKQTAAQMGKWLGRSHQKMSLPVYLRPGGVSEPRIVAGLQDGYIMGDREEIEGTYTVLGQVSKLLAENELVPTIRLVRDVPPTPMEVSTINEAMSNFIEPAQALGVDVEESDINIGPPAVLMRAIAIFQ